MRVEQWSRLTVLLVLLAGGGTSVWAQEPPPEPEPPETPTVAPTAADTPAPTAPTASLGDDGMRRWRLDVEQWVAQPSGLEDVAIVVADPNDPGGSLQFGTRHGTHGDPRIHLSYGFPADIGTLSLIYWSQNDVAHFSQSNAGNFSLGEALVPLQFGGVFDDRAADAVQATTQTKTRDLRLDFSRQAFTTSRVSARWSFGLRQVDYNRAFGARYFALAPNLTLVVDRADLDPLPDVASIVSRFSGRGPEFGFDVEVPLGKRFRVDAGVSAAVLRGDIATSYSSLTRLYAVQPPGADTIEQVLGGDVAPYLMSWSTIPLNDPTRPQVVQLTVPVGVEDESKSSSAQVLDAAASVHFRLWRELELYGGVRSTRYTDVAMEVRPVMSDVSLIGRTPSAIAGLPGLGVTVPVSGVQERERSVDYEGFFLGLAYRY